MSEGLKRRYEENFKPNFKKKDYKRALEIYKDFPEMERLLSSEEKGRMIYMTKFKEAYKNDNIEEAERLVKNNKIKKCLKSYELKKLEEYDKDKIFWQ